MMWDEGSLIPRRKREVRGRLCSLVPTQFCVVDWPCPLALGSCTQVEVLLPMVSSSVSHYPEEFPPSGRSQSSGLLPTPLHPHSVGALVSHLSLNG